MSIEIAYSSKKSRPLFAHKNSQSQAKLRFMKRISRLFGVGSAVLVNGTPGTVIGYNIADFGRWLAISHPIIVQLDSGEVIFSPSSEVSKPLSIARPFISPF